MLSSAWESVCTGTSAYFDVLFPGEGLNLFQVEPHPGRQVGDLRSGRSRHTVASYPVPETKELSAATWPSADSAWDKVCKRTSEYLDVLPTIEGQALSTHLAKRHTIGGYSSVPAREESSTASVDSIDGNAAPSFLEAYFELVFPGEGLNVFQDGSSPRPGKVRSGRARHTVAFRQTLSEGRSPTPIAPESSGDLVEVSSSDTTFQLSVSTEANGDTKGEPGSPGRDSASTASRDVLHSSSSDSSLDQLSHDNSEDSLAGYAYSSSNDSEDAAFSSSSHRRML